MRLSSPARILVFGLSFSVVSAFPPTNKGFPHPNGASPHPKGPSPPPKIDLNKFNPSDIIYKDVLIIGGGSSGTYGAIKLLDSNKTVIVVENKPRTGGHTDTYTDPTTGATVDYGVVVFHNNNLTRKYFDRFNISLAVVNLLASTSGLTTVPVDFDTGKTVTTFAAQDPTAALQGYYQQLQNYPYLEAGFNLTYPVPEDLLLPFGDFLKKYSLQNAAQLISQFAQGLGNVLDQPTLYVFKNFGSELIQDLSIGFLATADGNNGQLYTASAAELLSKDSLLLSSNIISLDRSSSPVRALVSTPTGYKVISAKQVLLTTPPKVPLLQFLDLSPDEKDLFSQFNNSAYNTALLRNTNIPANISFKNAQADSEYNLQRLPGLYSLIPTIVPGLIAAKFGSPYVLSDEDVKASIRTTIQTLSQQGLIPANNGSEVEFAAYAGHNPFELTVSTDAIRNGFYQRLGALQGERSTFYTGAAFHTHDSSMLWAFTENIVDSMLATL